MKDLKSFGLTELNPYELENISGGLSNWRIIVKALDWTLRASGVYAIGEEIKKGYETCIK